MPGADMKLQWIDVAVKRTRSVFTSHRNAVCSSSFWEWRVRRW